MLKRTAIFLYFVTLFALIVVSCSDNTASVPDPSINIIFPNGGDSLGLGVSYKITWTDDIDEDINLELYKGQDENAVRILQYSNIPSNGEYDFLVPIDSDTGSDYRFRLVSSLDSTISDISDNYFGFTGSVGDSNDDFNEAVEIFVPHLSGYAIYPAGDTDWYKVYLKPGSKYIFENSSETDFDSEFYLYQGDSAGTDISGLLLTDDDSGQGLQPMLQFSPETEGYYFLRVSHFSNDPSKFQEAETGYYTLSVTENILLISPNGGEIWEQGSVQRISWDPEITGNILIGLVSGSEYLFDIATVNASEGIYDWTVPESISSGISYKIRIQDEENSDIMDESNGYFSIAGTDTASVSGEWNVHGTWNKWDGLWNFSDDGTWTNSWGNSGTWELLGDIIQWNYDSGTYYIGIVDGDSMSGIMNGGSELNGTWTAQRVTEVR